MTPPAAGRVPGSVLAPVLAALGWNAESHPEIDRIGGGCIHPAVRLSVTDPPAGTPERAFLKWGTPTDLPGASSFPSEAEGLQLLAARGGPVVPEVLGVSPGSPDAPGWLLLEYLEPAVPSEADHARLGRALARLHRPLGTDATPGLEKSGWIATLPQDNAPRSSWGTFWREARLEPQLARARRHLSPGGTRDLERILDLSPLVLDDVVEGDGGDDLSLLHGDLWSGNVLHSTRGPALVDPAVYRGHREVDLAMMELFGGFPRTVFSAYEADAPLSPGYAEVRRGLYQLYPLLVHVNLFGAGYADRTEVTARRVLASMK